MYHLVFVYWTFPRFMLIFLYMMPGSKGLSPHELAHRWVKCLGPRPGVIRQASACAVFLSFYIILLRVISPLQYTVFPQLIQEFFRIFSCRLFRHFIFFQYGSDQFLFRGLLLQFFPYEGSQLIYRDQSVELQRRLSGRNDHIIPCYLS